jgi:seryl-tRNA synthetase
MGTHTNENGIILKELREDVKSMKVALSTLSEDVTTIRGEYQSLTKAIGNIISEGLKRMKSEILEGIAKGTIESVSKSNFDRDSEDEKDKNLDAALGKIADVLACDTPMTSPDKPISAVQVVASADQTFVKGRQKKGAEEAVRRQPKRKVCG